MKISDLIRYVKLLIAVFFKREVTFSRPVHIQLEPTSHCNLGCRSCSYKEKVKNPHNLTFDDYRELFDVIQPKKLTLSGVGETFLNPEIYGMIRYAKDNGANVNTSSNGTTIYKVAEKIVDSGLDLLKVSIDSDNRETYKEVRDDDFFDQVIDGVREVVKMKKEKCSTLPFLRFQFVIQKTNYREISGIIRLAKRLSVDAINFQILEITGIEERKEELIGDMSLEELEKELKEGDRIADELGMLTNLKQILRKLPLYWEKYSTRQGTPQECLLPWFSSYVDIDGNLRPCCSFGLTFTEAYMGNVLKDGLEESWNSEKYQQFRASIKDGTVQYEICKTCNPQSVRDMTEASKILPGFLKKGK